MAGEFRLGEAARRRDIGNQDSIIIIRLSLVRLRSRTAACHGIRIRGWTGRAGHLGRLALLPSVLLPELVEGSTGQLGGWSRDELGPFLGMQPRRAVHRAVRHLLAHVGP